MTESILSPRILDEQKTRIEELAVFFQQKHLEKNAPLAALMERPEFREKRDLLIQLIMDVIHARKDDSEAWWKVYSYALQAIPHFDTNKGCFLHYFSKCYKNNYLKIEPANAEWKVPVRTADGNKNIPVGSLDDRELLNKNRDAVSVDIYGNKQDNSFCGILPVLYSIRKALYKLKAKDGHTTRKVLRCMFTKDIAKELRRYVETDHGEEYEADTSECEKRRIRARYIDAVFANYTKNLFSIIFDAGYLDYVLDGSEAPMNGEKYSIQNICLNPYRYDGFSPRSFKDESIEAYLGKSKGNISRTYRPRRLEVDRTIIRDLNLRGEGYEM